MFPKLYQLLHRLDQRVLYFDTDSVKFIERDDESLVELGDGLGCLTDEVEAGYHITRFVATGPKSLAFELTNDLNHADKKYVIKLKGITLNAGNLEMVNFDEMVEILLNKNKVIRFINQSKITRNPTTMEMYNRVESKAYKLVYTKRIMQEDVEEGVRQGCVDTLPFGY